MQLTSVRKAAALMGVSRKSIQEALLHGRVRPCIQRGLDSLPREWKDRIATPGELEAAPRVEGLQGPPRPPLRPPSPPPAQPLAAARPRAPRASEPPWVLMTAGGAGAAAGYVVAGPVGAIVFPVLGLVLREFWRYIQRQDDPDGEDLPDEPTPRPPNAPPPGAAAYRRREPVRGGGAPAPHSWEDPP